MCLSHQTFFPVVRTFMQYLICRQKRRLLTILSTVRRLAKGGNEGVFATCSRARTLGPATRGFSGGLPPSMSVRLLDQLRERIRLLHYSLRTEEANVYLARAFIRFHGLRQTWPPP